MGGGKKGGKEAAMARQDEQQRQARIREGTGRINSIFDGSMAGDGALAAGTAFDPSAKYYTADGQAWAPETAAPGSLWTKPPEQQFADLVGSGGLYSGVKSNGGFNDAFYTGRRQSYIDYANPQLEEQYGKAQKELTFALDRAGLLDSSVRGQKVGELQQLYDLNKQGVADKALSYENEARTAVEDARSNLIATLNATGDAQGAANAALARSSALSQPAAYSPLSNLFSDFTASLGLQAAQDRANTATNKYSSGLSLFSPKTNAVKVSA